MTRFQTRKLTYWRVVIGDRDGYRSEINIRAATFAKAEALARAWIIESAETSRYYSRTYPHTRMQPPPANLECIEKMTLDITDELEGS